MVKKPIVMEVEFDRPLMAQMVSRVPLVRRKNIKSVSYKARGMVEIFQVFEVMEQLVSYARSRGPL